MPTLKQNATPKEREAYNKYYRLYRQKNRSKLRAYNRKYNADWRKKHGYPSEKKYRIKYPKKYRAKLKVRYALSVGKLVRQPCQFCGKKAQAHHDNYDKPLQVRWLCPLHHTAWHRTHRAVEKSS